MAKNSFLYDDDAFLQELSNHDEKWSKNLLFEICLVQNILSKLIYEIEISKKPCKDSLIYISALNLKEISEFKDILNDCLESNQCYKFFSLYTMFCHLELIFPVDMDEKIYIENDVEDYVRHVLTT